MRFFPADGSSLNVDLMKPNIWVDPVCFGFSRMGETENRGARVWRVSGKRIIEVIGYLGELRKTGMEVVEYR